MNTSLPIAAEAIRSCAVALAALIVFSMPDRAWAHCDSLEGPVIKDARVALNKGDLTPILKWIKKEREDEIRAAFRQTLAVRVQGRDAKALADRYFFETLVRIHRAGEGEAFTGVKPAGEVDPGIEAADEALKSGSAKKLAGRISAAVNEGIQKRFALALERGRHAADSVEAGRAYVEAYVDYIHYVESIHRLVSHGAAHVHPGTMANVER